MRAKRNVYLLCHDLTLVNSHRSTLELSTISQETFDNKEGMWREVAMIIVGERINGMFKDVRKAIKMKEKSVIQELARKQTEAGAHYLDVNVGPAAEDEEGVMQWLVETIQEVVDTPLSIDSPKPQVIKAGLMVCKKKAILNSTTAEDRKLDVLTGLAQEYGAMLLGLTMDEKGIPSAKEARLELGLKILAKAMEAGIPPDEVLLDPVVLPVKYGQDQCPTMLEVIRELKMISDPPPKTMIGLSNISQGCIDRSIVNRTYLVMAMSVGLDGAIMDPLDKMLMDTMITAELLLNRQIYCDSYLDAYRKSR